MDDIERAKRLLGSYNHDSEHAELYQALSRTIEDAERYRWIRSTTTPGYLHFPSGEIQEGLALDALDAAIDAAMNGANA